MKDLTFGEGSGTGRSVAGHTASSAANRPARVVAAVFAAAAASVVAPAYEGAPFYMSCALFSSAFTCVN